MTEFIAHRGVHDVFTENTLDAFQRALDLGFHGIEMDVHVTADGVCVVHHDESVVTPKVTLSIRGTFFTTLHDAAPALPRLDAALDLVAGRARAHIELKNSAVERELAEVVRATRADVSVHSFDHRTVLRIGRMMPQLRTGILQTSRLVDSVSVMRAAGATDLWQWHEFVDQALVEEVSASGGNVIAWTANSPSEWRVFSDLGVAAICTDLPISPTLASGHGSSNRGPSLDAID